MNNSLCAAKRRGFVPDRKQNTGGEENYAKLGK